MAPPPLIATELREESKMISTRAKPIHRPHAQPRAVGGDGGVDLRNDPAGLGALLRELATRAHHAVRVIDRAAAANVDPAVAARFRGELAEVYPRIVQLQRAVAADSSGELASYIEALRREVEERMG